MTHKFRSTGGDELIRNRQEAQGGPKSSSRMAVLLYQLRYELRTIAGNCPALYVPVVRWMRTNKHRFIDAGTELVIEGFPRSGNTFAQTAFEFAQHRKVQTAHHLHAPAQVIEAVKRGVPTLILIRPARDAVVAWKLTDPRLGLSQVLRSYVSYYQAIEPYVENCLVATFDQVTSDLGAVIERLNARYGTRFAVFPHTKANVDQVFAILRKIAYDRLPDRQIVENIPERLATREEQRTRLIEQFAQLHSRRAYKIADQIYQRFALYAVGGGRTDASPCPAMRAPTT